MDKGTLRRLTYSGAAGVVLVLCGILFIGNEFLWAYMLAASSVPVSVMLTTTAYTFRCIRSLNKLPKEEIVVGAKDAMDTMQLLELTPAGRLTDPLTGTNSFCLTPTFTLTYGLIIFSAAVLFLPAWLAATDDVNAVVIILAAFFVSALPLGFAVEYYTCCKRKYRAKKTTIYNARITRHPWISYVEVYQTYEQHRYAIAYTQNT